MVDIFIQPFLLGLSSGMFCLAYCVPFIAPYMVFEERKSREDFKVILKFISGRFIGYLLFGAIFGYLGEKINSSIIDLLLIISLMVLALILIFYAFGLMKEKRNFCFGPKIKNSAPLIMGFLMGINICPPFLMSLGYIFTMHNWLKGIIFFFFFFLATNVYFLPLTFLGFLNGMKEFRELARISGVIVGIMFLISGAYHIINYL